MKGNISRNSYREDARYSGVFQIQGGMVVDANLGEQAQIARNRTDALGHDTAGCGVPEEGGTVQIESGDLPRLREGVVFAEGVRGNTKATGPLPAPLSLYANQLDLPEAPDLPTNEPLILYADLWERTITQLEDPLLTDPGLHGAETAFRTRTMAQLKFAPLNMADALGDANGAFPSIGSGQLTVKPVDPETIADECDPCADTITAAQTVANALFRIEITQVHGDAQAPDRIVLAWSSENGAVVAPRDVNPDDFRRAGSVYEFFSRATECHLGVHAANGQAARSAFAADLVAGPARGDAPEGGPWPHVRRWDGAVKVRFGNGSANRVGTRGAGGVVVSGRKVSFTVDAFTATLDFENQSCVAGDYWLVELRRFAKTPVRAVQASPIGITHHYCPLFRIENGQPVKLSDEEHRRLSFPSLSDMPATHISFDNNCPKLYDDAENVQEALDNLCGISAADITFDPSGCPGLFDSKSNVQDALINLCKIDFGTDRLLRLLHDWGVICGVIPRLARQGSGIVNWTSGAILDRAGKLGDVKAERFDLDQIVQTSAWHFETLDQFAADLRENQVCLALALNSAGDVEPHLVPKSIAFGPKQPTFLAALEACRKAKPPFEIKKGLGRIAVKKRETLDKLFYSAAKPKLGAAQGLSGAESLIVRDYSDKLVERYKVHLNDSAESTKLDRSISKIDQTIRIENVTGTIRRTRRLQRETAVYQLVLQREAERLRECICEAMLPQCSELGEPPYFVPIACLKGRWDDRLFLDDLCVLSCRKQALSWRFVDYYTAEMRELLQGRLAQNCCPPDKEGGETVIDFPELDREKIFVAQPWDRPFDKEVLAGEIEKTARILTGRRPPGDYAVKPAVTDVGVERATLDLTGHGVEVAETIDVADSAAIKKLRDASVGVDAADMLLGDDALKPGDRVALITRAGVAVDWVKLEAGDGKNVFARVGAEPGTSAVGGLEISDEIKIKAEEAANDLETRVKAAADAAAAATTALDASFDRRSALTAEVASSEASLTALEDRREALNRNITDAETSLGTVRAERDILSGEVNALSTTLGEIKAERTNVLRATEEAREATRRIAEEQAEILAGAKKERDAVITSIRRETPVTAVARDNPRLATALASHGITNVSSLAEATDEDLSIVAREADIPLADARRIKVEASEMLKRPIG
jgi:hypothetical protein